MSQHELMVEARERLAPHATACGRQVLDAGGLGGAQAPLQVEIRGPDVRQLQTLSDAGGRRDARRSPASWT